MRELNTMLEVKQRNRCNGYYFFSPDTMRWFNSRICGELVEHCYFITSEKGPNNKREYTIRIAYENGKIGSLSQFGEYATLKRAQGALQRFIKSERVMLTL